MNFVEKKTLKTSEDRVHLKTANKDFTECISREYLNRFLGGEKVNVMDFCKAERAAMMDLD